MDIRTIGCGGITEIQVNEWRDRGISVPITCDINEKATIQFIEDWKIPSHYSRFSKMFRKEKLFAGVMCIPHSFCANVAVSALKSGYNIIAEKMIQARYLI